MWMCHNHKGIFFATHQRKFKVSYSGSLQIVELVNVDKFETETWKLLSCKGVYLSFFALSIIAEDSNLIVCFLLDRKSVV